MSDMQDIFRKLGSFAEGFEDVVKRASGIFDDSISRTPPIVVESKPAQAEPTSGSPLKAIDYQQGLVILAVLGVLYIALR